MDIEFYIGIIFWALLKALYKIHALGLPDNIDRSLCRNTWLVNKSITLTNLSMHPFARDPQIRTIRPYMAPTSRHPSILALRLIHTYTYMYMYAYTMNTWRNTWHIHICIHTCICMYGYVYIHIYIYRYRISVQINRHVCGRQAPKAFRHYQLLLLGALKPESW